MSIKKGAKVVVLHSLTVDKHWHGRTGIVVNRDSPTECTVKMENGTELLLYYMELAEIRE
jgi:hypothetical protein